MSEKKRKPSGWTYVPVLVIPVFVLGRRLAGDAAGLVGAALLGRLVASASLVKRLRGGAEVWVLTRSGGPARGPAVRRLTI